MVHSFVNINLGLKFSTQTSQSLLFSELVPQALQSGEEAIVLPLSTGFPPLPCSWVRHQSLGTSPGSVSPGQMGLI